MPADRAFPRGFSLGVGLTNACDLSCAHCYRSPGEDALRASDVLRAALALPTRAVNFGTGENGLHPDFAPLVRALRLRGIDVAMTTNGRSAASLEDEDLARFGDVEFSIDYPTPHAHDRARAPGNWALVERQMERCSALGVRTTIVAVMMSTNYRELPALAAIARERGALVRVNVYQSVRTDAFSLSYEQFWEGWRRLLEVADLVTCGEPILRAVLGLRRDPGAGCGVETVRLTPRGSVVPCVYGADAPAGIDDLVRLGGAIVEEESFRAARTVPAPCTDCPHVETCGGGCAVRRSQAGGIGLPDPYCPFVRGEVVSLAWRRAAKVLDQPKTASACTTTFRPR
ncbi:MAG: radical SAM protein [Myxococcota bacterium]